MSFNCIVEDNNDDTGDSDGNGNSKGDGDGEGNGGCTPCNNNDLVLVVLVSSFYSSSSVSRYQTEHNIVGSTRL